MKRIAAIIFVIVCCLCLILTVVAEDVEAVGGTVVSVMGFRMTSRAYVSEIPETLDYLANELNCTYGIIERDGVEYEADIPLRWMLDEPPTGAGLHIFVADVLAPEGCIFAEGVPQQLILKYMFYEDPVPEEPKELVALVPRSANIGTRMLPLNDGEALAAIIDNIMFNMDMVAAVTENNWDSVNLILERFESDVQTDMTGVYEIRLYYMLAPEDVEGFILPEAVRVLRIPVYVFDPDLLTITYGNQTGNYINIASSHMIDTALFDHVTEYVYSADALLSDEALRSAAWQPLDTVMYKYASFDIPRSFFETGKNYYIRFRSGDKISNILWLMDDGREVLYSDKGGDRDGGDGSGARPPEITQDPPDLDNNTGGDDTDDEGIDSGGIESGNGNGNVGSGGEHQQTPPLYIPPALYLGLGTYIRENDTTKQTADQSKEDKKMPPPVVSDQSEALQEAFQEEAEVKIESEVESGDDNTQPTTEPLPLPTGVPVTPTIAMKESFGETRDIISGTRLRMMLEDTGAARFSKQGVTITISAQVLAQLDIKDTDRISVTIERLSNTTFRFNIELNGVLLSDLPETVVMLPYQKQSPSSELIVTDELGSSRTGSYDSSLETASFMVDHTGQFIISENIQEVYANSSEMRPTNTVQRNNPTINNPTAKTPKVDTALTHKPVTAASATPKSVNMPLMAVAIVLPITVSCAWFFRKRWPKR